MPVTESVTLENFRCFRERQTVRLAPLTLLVGENSTGKTSFLALIRALSEFAYEGSWPDFKTPPYDLGSFNEIVHSRGGRRSTSFVGGVTTCINRESADQASSSQESYSVSLEVTFCKPSQGTSPTPIRKRIVAGNTWVDERLNHDTESYDVNLGTERGTWSLHIADATDFGAFGSFLRFNEAFRQIQDADDLDSLQLSEVFRKRLDADDPDNLLFRPIDTSPVLSRTDEQLLHDLDIHYHRRTQARGPQDRLFSGAPVRSRPRRTYNSAGLRFDPEGDYVPSFLADLAFRRDPAWPPLKEGLEAFGRQSGLFDEVNVRLLGTGAGDPFELQIRKGDRKRKGALRNLIDVGYGVSQVLPLITELLRTDGVGQFLLQQPEVHLHPQAQAALGTLFCQVAAAGRQLIVETHSDHLIDRIRMDVRDGKTDLKPEDVRVLYFERDGLDVKIHEIWYDQMGNLVNTPSGYRSFFMQEVERSVWPPE